MASDPSQIAEDRDAERAWFAGIDARRNEVKLALNPHPPGSRAWNCWRGAWMAEDHNSKDADNAR